MFYGNGDKKRGTGKDNSDRKEVTEHFYGKEVDYNNSISGVIDGQNSHIHVIKDPDYTMMLMTEYGPLEISGNEIKFHINGETVRFKYPNIVWNHYT